MTVVLHCHVCPVLSRLSCTVTFVLYCHVCPVLSPLSLRCFILFSSYLACGLNDDAIRVLARRNDESDLVAAAEVLLSY